MTADRGMFPLWPKQQYAFELIWREGVEQLLYGGSAGGGKSELVRAMACYLANLWPGSEISIFRRTDQELQANHVNPWLERVDPYVPGGHFFQQKMQYAWPSPAWCWCPKGAPCPHSSTTVFRHVDDNRGAKKHHGAQFAAQFIDEATHFKPADIELLYTRVRAPADSKFPREVTGPDGRPYAYPGWPDWLKLQVLTANPGDVGHQFMLDNFIDPVSGLTAGPADEEQQRRSIVSGPDPLLSPEGASRWEERIAEDRWLPVDMTGGQVWTVEIDIGAGREPVRVRRAFVPARLADNPSLDPVEYAANLAVGSAEQRRRLLDGDWSYSADRIFSMLARDVHVVDTRRVFGTDLFGAPKPPPHGWPRGIGQDHGTAKPTAAVWLCQEDEGFFIAYDEYYRPGPVGQHVRAIKEMMDRDGHPELTLQADPRLWHQTQGINQQLSIAAIYAHLGEPPADPVERRYARENGIRLRQSTIEDKAALLGLQGMLEPDPQRLFPYWHPLAGKGGAPLLFIAERCRDTWRELTNLKSPGLEGDGMYGEGIKNGQADHAYDALKRIAEPLRRALVSRGRQQGPRIILEAV